MPAARWEACSSGVAYECDAPTMPLPADPLAYACCSPQKHQLLEQQAHLQQQLLSAVGDDGEKSRQQAQASRRIFVGNLAPRMVGR